MEIIQVVGFGTCSCERNICPAKTGYNSSASIAGVEIVVMSCSGMIIDVITPALARR